MKIAVFHSSRAIVGEDFGGGATYERSVASLFDELSIQDGLEVCHFIPRKRGFRFRKLAVSGRQIYEFRSGLLERIASRFPASVAARVLENSRLMTTSCHLRTAGFDVAYFTSPSSIALRLGTFPYVFTVWDFGHIELPGFPEVWAQSIWVDRERIYALGSCRALHVFVDSPITGIKLEERYRLPRDRWTATGLLPRIREEVDHSREITGDYIIYPAKFWPHKNHATILHALAILKQKGRRLKLVLTGSDVGNLRNIETLIGRLGLQNDVLILENVGRERLLSLIKNSKALVMPSLLGPTNLPPLEALQLGIPAIVSDAHSFGPSIDRFFRRVPALDCQGWAREIGKALDKTNLSKPVKITDSEALNSHSIVFRNIRNFLLIAGQRN